MIFDTSAQPGGRSPRVQAPRHFPRLQDLGEEWHFSRTNGLFATATDSSDGDRTHTIFDPSRLLERDRVSTTRQLRMLREMQREMRARSMRADLDITRHLRSDSEIGRLMGTAIDVGVGEPCPLSEEWQLLGDLAGAEPMDLELKVSPQPCGLLRPGQRFRGTQCVNRTGASPEDWSVSVQIDECDWDTGYMCGSMTAENVPQSSTPVSTFFEGELIGVGGRSFLTDNWGACRQSDIAHWAKFSAFQKLQQQLAESDDGAASAASPPEDVVFMRWKEKCFETKHGESSGLTIAGFYYLCFKCSDASIEGFYYDSNSQPFQKLKLKAASVSHHGYSTASYQFA